MPSFIATPHPTPFGFFDADPVFQVEAEAVVPWVKTRLGDAVLSVELSRKTIWSCLEEATLVYSEVINEFNITSNLINVLGTSTGSDLTNKYIHNTLDFLIRQAEPYATEAQVGGAYNLTLGYININQGQQDYNIYDDILSVASGSTGQNLWLSFPSGSRGRMRIQEVFHFEPFAAQQFLLNASNITNFLATSFNYESYFASTVFYVLPLYEDILRRGALEHAARVRRSNFSWEIMGSQLRIYPIPTGEFQLGKLFLTVTVGNHDPLNPDIGTTASGSSDSSVYGVSGPSNYPVNNIPYGTITSPGRNWIRQYCLALCRETLGLIRNKIKTIPIPNADLQLDGAELIQQARDDKEKLLAQLREWLGGLTNQALLEKQAEAATALNTQLKFMPIPAGKAITIR